MFAAEGTTNFSPRLYIGIEMHDKTWILFRSIRCGKRCLMKMELGQHLGLRDCVKRSREAVNHTFRDKPELISVTEAILMD